MEAKKACSEKQVIFRSRRGEQKEIQLSFDHARIHKFASLIEKREDKYINLAQLARSILILLSQENVGKDDKDVSVELFKDVPQVQLKMNTQHAGNVSDEVLAAQEVVINDLREKYTKKGSPKEFKKVFKYDTLYNWASQFIEVVKAAKEAEQAQTQIDNFNKEMFDVQDEI